LERKGEKPEWDINCHIYGEGVLASLLRRQLVWRKFFQKKPEREKARNAKKESNEVNK